MINYQEFLVVDSVSIEKTKLLLVKRLVLRASMLEEENLKACIKSITCNYHFALQARAYPCALVATIRIFA